jgi:hypothetical protein
MFIPLNKKDLRSPYPEEAGLMFLHVVKKLVIIAILTFVQPISIIFCWLKK